MANPKPTFTALGMFPYPSGAAHLGHVLVYTITDVRARMAARRGWEVLHPIGWDAFGLPAENAAIAHGVDPAAWTATNIEQMRRSFRRMGWSFDWDREIDTSDPSYHRWTQWLFARMMTEGLAYRDAQPVPWCARCGTVLAHEQVQEGACWRCASAVEIRRVPGWFLRLSQYAERLDAGLADLPGWDPRAVATQRAWIRRRRGAVVHFGTEQGSISVFTTRVDTVFGVSALVVAPEHPMAAACEAPAVVAYVRRAEGRRSVERMQGKTGVRMPVVATHPLTGAQVPVFVGDFVLPTVGTGAVMCVPAHDGRDHAFAAVHDLPMVRVVEGGELPFVGEGVLVDSGDFTGMRSGDARQAIVGQLEACGRGEARVVHALRDWSVSRQRSWGCPIPVVHCGSCGPVVVPTDELPVLRDAPRVRPCPACGEPAERDPDTLDTFVCSSWYAFRFADPHNAEAPFSRQAVDRWMPIDVYVGGLEHAGQHMIYFRFVTAVLHDLGLVGFSEPVKQFFCNGMVKLGGRKMSKSSGCSVGPDEVVEQFGPDALRLAILGDGPADQDQEWDPEGPARKARFLRRMEAGIEAWRGRWDVTEEPQRDAAFYRALAPLRADIEENRFHVGVARLHSAANRLRQVMDVDVTGSARAMVQDWLVAMSPFAPAFASRLSRHFFDVDVHATPWPEVEPGSLDGALRMVAVQVNGRTIGQVAVAAGADNAEHTRAAMAHPAVSRRGGATPRRVIVVPGRVVNLVMAPPRTSDAP